MNWLLENWQGLIGGGTVTTVATYIANRKNNKADFLTKVEGIYESLVDQMKSDRELLKAENKEEKDENRKTRQDLRDLQKQFNDLFLAYAKEVEESKYWKDKFEILEKRYNALEKKNKELEAKDELRDKEHEELKKAHEDLKVEFEEYKILKK